MMVTETKGARITWAWTTEKDHPMWGIVKILVTVIALSVFLWLNASHFDRGEIKTIGGAGVVALILEGFNFKKKS